MQKYQSQRTLATCLAVWSLHGNAWVILVKWCVTTKTSTDFFLESSDDQKPVQTSSNGLLDIMLSKGLFCWQCIADNDKHSLSHPFFRDFARKTSLLLSWGSWTEFDVQLHHEHLVEPQPWVSQVQHIEAVLPWSSCLLKPTPLLKVRVLSSRVLKPTGGDNATQHGPLDQHPTQCATLAQQTHPPWQQSKHVKWTACRLGNVTYWRGILVTTGWQKSIFDRNVWNILSVKRAA